MTVSTLNFDVFIGVKIGNSLTIIPIKPIDVRYILLGFVSYCLSIVSQMLDKPVEMSAWCQVAVEWIKIYAIELAGVILCRLSKDPRWG